MKGFEKEGTLRVFKITKLLIQKSNVDLNFKRRMITARKYSFNKKVYLHLVFDLQQMDKLINNGFHFYGWKEVELATDFVIRKQKNKVKNLDLLVATNLGLIYR